MRLLLTLRSQLTTNRFCASSNIARAAANSAKFGGLPRPNDLKVGAPGPNGKILETQGDVKRARAWLVTAVKAHKAGQPIPPFGGADEEPEKAAVPEEAPAAAPAADPTDVPSAAAAVAVAPSAAPAASKQRPAKAATVLGLALLPAEKQVSLFAHLPQPDQDPLVGIKFGVGRDNVHPAFRALGLRYASGDLVGSTARLAAFVRALHTFLLDFQPESSTAALAEGSFASAAVRALRPVLRYLRECRPLLLPLDTLVRLFRAFAQRPAVAALPYEDARQALCAWVSRYLDSHVIDLSEDVAKSAAGRIAAGDVVLAYAHSSIVEAAVKRAHADGKAFSVIVVDARPRQEGLQLASRLAQAGVSCDYADISALSYVVKSATKVLLGVHAVFCNGSALSRTGTALVAMHAKANNVPVLVCCQSFKFTDTVQLDAICNNDVGTPDDLLLTATPTVAASSAVTAAAGIAAGASADAGPSEAEVARSVAARDPFSPAEALLPLSAATPLPTEVKKAQVEAQTRAAALAAAAAAADVADTVARSGKTGKVAAKAGKADAGVTALPLTEWRDIKPLKLLNINYDVTPADLITAVITESRIPVPTTSAPAILREFTISVDRSVPE
jgi:translation initiation factor eIF-2B subunit delta